REVVGDAPAAQDLLRQQEVAHVEAEREVLGEVELDAHARLPGQTHDRLVEGAAGAGDGEDVAVYYRLFAPLELRVDGRPEHRGDALEGGARDEVVLLREAAERLLEAELHRRARDEHLEAEVLGRIEGEGATVAVRGRER